MIYYERDEQQGQYAVVTETQGVKKGQRVVRGINSEAPDPEFGALSQDVSEETIKAMRSFLYSCLYVV